MILFVVLLGVAAWLIGEMHHYYSEQRADVAAEYYDETQNSLALCRDASDFFAALMCAYEENAAQHDEYTSYKNLEAQHHMSLWALGVFVVSVFALIITATGVYFVWLTLKETAAGIDVMRDEQRPWAMFLFDLNVSKQNTMRIGIRGGPDVSYTADDTVTIKFGFENIGKTIGAVCFERRIVNCIENANEQELSSLLQKTRDELLETVTERTRSSPDIVLAPGERREPMQTQIGDKNRAHGEFMILCLAYPVRDNIGFDCRVLKVNDNRFVSEEREDLRRVG